MRFRALSRAAVATASVSALALSGLPVARTQEAAPARFTVANITDFHGRWAFDSKGEIPGALNLKCELDKAEEAAGADSFAFTSSGDNIGASPFASMVLDDEPTIDVLDQMGLDVSAVGNHEFDKGAADLVERVAPGAEWTYLAAGADGIDDSIRPYVIKELGGAKVAFIGSVTKDMPSLVSPAGIEGITWNDPVESINKVADELTESGEADVVVALPHEGNIDASAWSDNVDVVFMGHTHQFVEPADTHPLVLQAGSYSKGLATISLSYDKATDKITADSVSLKREGDLMACDTQDNLAARYPEIHATITEAQAAAEEQGAQQIGELDRSLYRGANADEESGSNRGVESQLNNLLADVAKWGVSKNSSVAPEIGVMNAGGVRDDLLEGPVTYAEAFSVQPFGNELTYTTLKGSDFKEALEQQWKTTGERPVLSLGVSDNVSYTYDETRPQGERITSVLVDGEPLDPNRDYIVAGSTFLLTGGDGFTALTKGTDNANLGYTDIQGWTEYLKAYLGGDDTLAPRTGQAGVAVHVQEPLKAGAEATIDLSSLIYTQGETAKTVTVTLGDASATADIDTTYNPANLGEAGKATATLTVPAGLSGEQELRVTTDAGTDVWVPVTVEGTPAQPSVSSANPLQAVLLAVAGLIGLGGLLALVFPHQVDALLGKFARF